ncbi:n-alkane-inducible cytochrome P450 [Rhexocercosporidium sp. MPI-PUGE-AT-0058]|nr:n-alkane-inducible cytochrome P450 [Rhexocercosporidium sp. MPI-PUGE-AT-0058]
MFDSSTKFLLFLLPALVSAAIYIRVAKAHRRNDSQTQADIEYINTFHCMPLKRLPYKWPFALDLLWEAYNHAVDGRILRFFTMLITPLPPTFEQKLLGTRGIDTIDPKIIEAILSTQFKGFGMGDRPAVWKPFIGPGIFTQDGNDWKHSRDLLRPLFMSRRAENFLEIQESAEALVKCIPDGKIVDFQPLMFGFTLDTTMYLLFGRAIRSLGDGNKEAKAFGEAFRISQEYLSHRGRLGPLHWLLNPKRFRDSNAVVHKWIDKEIEEALNDYNSSRNSAESRMATNYGFLGNLLGDTQDPKVLRDALLNVLLAGRDTTGCLLTWTMRLLVKHERVMSKLKDEVRRIVGVGSEARTPDRNDIKKMQYLSYILKEVLRLYPSVPINSRTAIKTTVLPTGGGPDSTSPILVKEGTPVGYAVYAMHRRKELYGNDAELFRPERWDPQEDTNSIDLKNIGWGYLPFNGGPRTCIGQDFAFLESSYVVVRLLQEFRSFECDPARPMPAPGQERQDVTLVLASGDGCWILTERTRKRE